MGHKLSVVYLETIYRAMTYRQRSGYTSYLFSIKDDLDGRVNPWVHEVDLSKIEERALERKFHADFKDRTPPDRCFGEWA